ncbi:MAG: GTP-binding protein [Candidatus Heimdallarchaeota archaeon]|nr:GTP-binding protein [Candidatus Heimdallarchaeota archaeon]
MIIISSGGQKYDFTFKILLLGDGAVGKTALVHRFVHDKFASAYLMTIGMEPYSRYETIDGVKIVYSLWDIAGQDRFKVMRQMFFRGAMGALVTFDLTRKDSFENTINWINEAKAESPDILFILVGNKNDLEDQREVTTEYGMKKADELGAVGYIETSALTGDNVAEAFRKIGKKLLDERR